nr:bile acid:sodium symporter [Amphibacillus cookii]
MIFLAVVIGLALGQVSSIQIHADRLITPFLIVMLFITFLDIPLVNVMQAFKNVRFTVTSILINFVWTPLLAWGLATIFLGNQPSLYIGFIMLMVTPCTDWYLIFTSIAKGNVALSTAILPLNLVLQVVLLPIYLLLFTQTTGMVEPTYLLESIIVILLIPITLAGLLQIVLKKSTLFSERVMPTLRTLPMIFLALAIVAMFATHGRLLFQHLDMLGWLLAPIFLFFFINLFVTQSIGKRLRFCQSDRVSLSLTTLARNSPLSLAIAMTAFSDQPLIALTLVIGPLLELPILALISQILLWIKQEK